MVDTTYKDLWSATAKVRFCLTGFCFSFFRQWFKTLTRELFIKFIVTNQDVKKLISFKPLYFNNWAHFSTWQTLFFNKHDTVTSWVCFWMNTRYLSFFSNGNVNSYTCDRKMLVYTMRSLLAFPTMKYTQGMWTFPRFF